MPSQPGLYRRKSLDQITTLPDSIISVYVVENHIWAEGGSPAARAARRSEPRTVREFLINPVRSFLTDLFRLLAAPYVPSRKDNPIGQGYWIQAEFGSGKSHLLSLVGALAMGEEATWQIIRNKEQEAGLGRRESLYNFYENGLAKKTTESKGIFVAVQTLVGQGGGTIGLNDRGRTLTEYILDAVADQFYLETGRSLPLYPTQLLAQRFLKTGDFERYQRDLGRFLKDPTYFDEEGQEDLSDFLDDLQTNPNPAVQRDCGQRLWDFYTRYLQIRPQLPMETEEVLKHMVQRLLDEGYAGLLLILDEVSLFMKGRAEDQRIEDEKALVVLSNRLAKVENLPVWTVCAAQQAIETKMAGVKNIIARERLDLVPLLNNRDAYYDIALSRVRSVTDLAAVNAYYEDYRRSFSWPASIGQDQFARFFPFYPPGIDVVRAVSYNLTTVRSALYFMLETLKTQRKRQSRELITLWALFEDVVNYEEDPSGTTRSIAAVKTKWGNEWKAYEAALLQLDTITKGPLKVYRSRCEKIVRTLFLYHVANLAPDGLSAEDLMNSVMEWRDHDREQQADLQDNQDHYESLADRLASELAQVAKIGRNYRFNPTGGGPDPRERFQKARAEAEGNEVLRRQAWEALLGLKSWQVQTRLMTLDLAMGLRAIFHEIAPASQTDVTVKWHGRLISGRIYMRDLLAEARRKGMLPAVNSDQTGLDFMVFVSSTPALADLESLVVAKKDSRVLFWSPDALTPSESSLLTDFAAYRTLVADFGGLDSQDAKTVLEWVQGRVSQDMGKIYRIVPDSYARGRIQALDHSSLDFTVQGEMTAILTPLVGQVLDSLYASRDLEFDAPAPFDDTNAVNVINGIVKVGEILRGAKPTKEISAAQNYGFALQIMRRPNDRKLDLSACRYTQALDAWIASKLGDSEATLKVDTVYKNFMGSGGPNGIHYGLSRRLVQLYLLCLAREAKIRISLSGRNLPVEVIDYSNIADIDFKVAVLDAFDQVQRLKPPQGWQLLMPYAAVILEEDSLRQVRQDAEIRAGLQRLETYRQRNLKPFCELRAGLDDLFQFVGQTNPLAERLAAWEQFLQASVKMDDPVPFLLDALHQAFGYQVDTEDAINQAEVDDLASRRSEVRQAETFYGYRDRLRAAARYVSADIPDDPALDSLRTTLQRGRSALERLPTLMTNETRLLSELLDPLREAIQSYSVRYLQLFDQVVARSEEARGRIEQLEKEPAYLVLERLAAVPQLGADLRPAVQQALRQLLSGSALFPAHLTRSAVERELHERPQPPDCPLTLANAGEWLQRADEAVATGRSQVQEALLDKATLLHSDSLRNRLRQGPDDPFIASLLAANSPVAVAQVLGQTLGANQGRIISDEPGYREAALLTRYLTTIRVHQLRLADFRPSKRTLERSDVETIAAEFRLFLLNALLTDSDELPVVELE